MRNLKFLAPFSTVANILTFVGFGITIYYLFSEEGITLDDKKPFGKPEEFPLFFGTVLFALEAIGVVSKYVLCLIYYNIILWEQ